MENQTPLTPPAKLPAVLLSPASHSISMFCSTDESRYALCGVRYRHTRKELCATDGRCAIRVPVEYDTGDEFPACKNSEDAPDRDFTIPVKSFVAAMKNLLETWRTTLPILSKIKMTFCAKDQRVTLTRNDLDAEQGIRSKTLDASWPEGFDNIWPMSPPKQKIIIDFRMLKRLVEYAEQAANSMEPGISLGMDDGISALRFELKTKDGLTAKGLIMPMRE